MGPVLVSLILRPPSLPPLFEIAGREREGGARSVNSASFLGTLGVSRKNVASKSYLSMFSVLAKRVLTFNFFLKI